MSAAVYILAAVVAVLLVLLVALVLCWMQPRRKAKLSGGTMTIDIECDSAKAMAQIAELTAAVERLDAAQRKAGLNLPVRYQATDPVMNAMRKSPEYAGKAGTTMKPQRDGQAQVLRPGEKIIKAKPQRKRTR
jgi:hypothetical protein